MNIILIHEGQVQEFESIRRLLDWTVGQLALATKTERASDPKVEAPSRADAVTEKVTEQPKKEEPQVPNSFDLPPMKKPFFGGINKGNKGADLRSFLYTINGEAPKTRPADVARTLFTKTKAFLGMPKKDQEKVITWGLSFLKKQVRESDKPASVTTNMAVSYEIDRFRFLAGAEVTFRVSYKD